MAREDVTNALVGDSRGAFDYAELRRPPHHDGRRGDKSAVAIRRTLGLAALAAAIVSTADWLRVVFSSSAHVTNEDQTLAWAAAREWGRLAWHEPGFYGQSYSSTFESIPIEALHRLGVEYGAAMPFVLAFAGLASWFVLAFAAWRRRRYLLAVVAAAAPSILSSYYALFVAFNPMAAGRLLAATAAAVLIGAPRQRVATTGAWALAWFAIALDLSTAILVIPVGLWFAFRHWQTIRDAVLPAVAALPAAAWVLYVAIFYRTHGDYLTQADVSPRPRLDLLADNRRMLHQFFGMFSAELLRAWWLPVVALLALGLAMMATRRIAIVAPMLSVLALVVLAMANDRTRSPSWTFLPYARLILLLPIATWFLALILVEHRSAAPNVPRLPSAFYVVTALAIVGLALTSTAVRAVAWDSRVESTIDRGLAEARAGGYGLLERATITEDCNKLADIAKESGTQLIVFRYDAARTYGCEALHGDEVDTLLLRNERRTWRLYEERDRRRSGLVLVGAPPGLCDSPLPQPIRGCRSFESELPGVVTLAFTPSSPLDATAALGLPAREFGPDCKRINFTICVK